MTSSQHYQQILNNRSVSDRLITMGKIYEAKRNKMREVIFNERKQQEDQLMKRPKTAAGGGQGLKKNPRKGERIEDRLMEQKKK